MQKDSVLWTLVPFIEQLKRKGFLEIGGISSDARILYCVQNGIPYVLCFAEYNETALFLDEIEEKIRAVFVQNAYIKIELLIIAASNNMTIMQENLCDRDNCWLLDNTTKNLFIYEKQPADFFGIRRPLENFLHLVQARNQSQESTVYENNIQENMNQPDSAITFGFRPASRNISDYLTISNLLILFNVFVYILTAMGGDLHQAQYLVKCGGLIVPLMSGEYYRIFTCIFLHSGIMHLLSNIIYLYLIGNDVEKFVSKPAFACIFFGGGVSGSLFTAISYMNTHNYRTVSVGASGACMALLGAIVVLRFFDDKVKDYISISLLVVLVVINCTSIFDSGSNVNYIAHLGGLIGGAVITFIYCCIRKRKEKKL